MKYLLLLFITILPFALQAQEKEDVIYLENGSIIRGEILKSDDSTTVKIKIVGGSIFVFNKAEIISTTREKKTPVYREKGPITVKQNGFWGEFNFGLPAGSTVGNDYSVGVSFNAIMGYQYSPKLRLGLGTGIDHYYWESTFSPMFARLSGDFFDAAISPIYFVDLGYGFRLNPSSSWKEYHGGYLTNVGMGLKFNTRRRTNFNIVTSYKIQAGRTDIYEDWTGSSYTEYNRFHRIETKFVIGF
ncbi:MAG: hypothetical protein KDC92_01865 [Bacteroidetes bacterium]|nr:hypothetical protein [Bacteroidota bacterium]